MTRFLLLKVFCSGGWRMRDFKTILHVKLRSVLVLSEEEK